MASSARKGLPFNSASRLDFEAEFGLQSRDHDGCNYQDDRIQNILLDEICSDFGIKDSIDLDLYNLDTPYPMTRLSDDLEELDQTIPFGKLDAETELRSSMMPPPSMPNRLRNQSGIPTGSLKCYPSKTGPPLVQGFIEKSDMVASPTISSSCEGGVSGATVTGAAIVVKPQPPDSTSGDCGGSGGWSNVHSTTASGGCTEEEVVGRAGLNGGNSVGGKKLKTDSGKCQIKEERGDTTNYSSHVKLENSIPESQAIPANVVRNSKTHKDGYSNVVSRIPSSLPMSRIQTSSGIPNFSASPSVRPGYQNAAQVGVTSAHGPGPATGVSESRGNAVSVPTTEEVGMGESGTTSCSTSTSVSPSQMHVAKKLRTINSGSDLLEEVRECFAYVHGADLFAPTSHASFNDPHAGAFKPQFDDQKNMNFGGQVSFTGREFPQQQHQQQSGPVYYPQGGSDVYTDSPMRRMNAPQAYMGDQQSASFDAMGRSRGSGGGYGPGVGYNVSSPSAGYQSCPDLTSPDRKVPPFSPGVQGSPYQSRPYSPAVMSRPSQQYDMGTVPLGHQPNQPTLDNLRNPLMTPRNNSGYGSAVPPSVRPDGVVGYGGLGGNSPRPGNFPQAAMPQSPASMRFYQQQTQSAPCTPSKQRWDGTYNQGGAIQPESFRSSPSSMMMMSRSPHQMLDQRGVTAGVTTVHGGQSMGRMQVNNQFAMAGSGMNNNNVCQTPGKITGRGMNSEFMGRMNKPALGGGNEFGTEGYNTAGQDGRGGDERGYSTYSPGLTMNFGRQGRNYPTGPQAGGETFANNASMPPPNTAPHHSSRAPQSSGAFLNSGGPAHDLPLSQHSFLRRLIGEDSGAFRVHPLYPLLRDLIIADMNFHTPSFPFQLIANLPCDFSRLLCNYRTRNPGLSLDHADPTVQMVVMDAVKYAHSALIGMYSSWYTTIHSMDSIITTILVYYYCIQFIKIYTFLL